MYHEYPSDAFAYMVDIGANVGTVTIPFLQHFPQAKVYACEPCIKTFHKLQKNVGQCDRITFISFAFGNGLPLYLQEVKYDQYTSDVTTLNMFVEEEQPTYAVPSYRLHQIFDLYKLDTSLPFSVKIDCEGSEACLLNDSLAEEILLKAKHVGIEIHFSHTNISKCKRLRFKNLPAYEEYEEWIGKLFSNHTILYHRSNRRRGHGVYVMRKDS
jgi:FkbM family methyltransferase